MNRKSSFILFFSGIFVIVAFQNCAPGFEGADFAGHSKLKVDDSLDLAIISEEIDGREGVSYDGKQPLCPMVAYSCAPSERFIRTSHPHQCVQGYCEKEAEVVMTEEELPLMMESTFKVNILDSRGQYQASLSKDELPGVGHIDSRSEA